MSNTGEASLGLKDPRVNAYLHYYQHGGGMPVFRGAPDQYGGGLGEILRSVFRTVFPIVMPIAATAAKSFIANTARGVRKGKSLKDASKAALKPTARAAITHVGRRIRTQIGSGKRKRKSSRVYKKGGKRTKVIKKTRRSKKRRTNF